MTALPRTTAEACARAFHAAWAALDELDDHENGDPCWDDWRAMRNLVGDAPDGASYVTVPPDLATTARAVLSGLTELYAALGCEPQSCAWNTHRQVVQAALEEQPLTPAERAEQAEELRGDGEREEAA